MNDNYKVSFEDGEVSFEAEGPREGVEEILEYFKENILPKLKEANKVIQSIQVPKYENGAFSNTQNEN